MHGNSNIKFSVFHNSSSLCIAFHKFTYKIIDLDEIIEFDPEYFGICLASDGELSSEYASF